MTGLTSPTHIVLLLLIALLLFGAKRLPEIGRSLGSSMREFKDSMTEPNAPKELSSASVETISTAREERDETAA